MTKNQVLSTSVILSIPAGLFLAFTVLSALSHGGSYSLAAWILVCLTGLICLFILLPAPLWILLWYPAEGLSGRGAATQSPAPADTDDDLTDDASEDAALDDAESFDDDGEQLFDGDVMDDDEFDDDLGDFDDDRK